MSQQHCFAEHLLDPELATPPGLRSWNGSHCKARFDVYRNNVASSLVAALSASFPVLEQLVGTALFQAMARVFVQQQPPQSRILAFYGGGFANFIAAFEPASHLSYLADVARLEFLRIHSYHAADRDGLTPQALGQALANPEQVGQLIFQLHPSVQLLRSRYAVFSLWAAHQDGPLDISQVDPSRPEQLMIVRNQLDCEVIPISTSGWIFIYALRSATPFAEAVEHAQQADPEFDATPYLTRLIQLGALVGYRFATPPPKESPHERIHQQRPDRPCHRRLQVTSLWLNRLYRPFLDCSGVLEIGTNQD